MDSVPTVSPSKEAKCVLLTGSMGDLGCHVLHCLARDPSVGSIFCVNILQPGDFLGISDHTSKTSQQNALSDAGIVIDHDDWAKIQFLELYTLDSFYETHQFLDRHLQPSYITRACESATHIIHLAWPDDFQRVSQIFRSHVLLVEKLLELILETQRNRPDVKIKMIFPSSIATVGRYPNNIGLHPRPRYPTKTEMYDLDYVECKWLGEQKVARTCPSGDLHQRKGYPDSPVETIVLRMGQLSGPKETGVAWKTNGHIPTLLKVSQTIGALPRLQGTMSWLPVDRAARSLLEILFHPGPLSEDERIIHFENPVRHQSSDFITIAAKELGIRENAIIPLDEWLNKAAQAGCLDNFRAFHYEAFWFFNTGGRVVSTDPAQQLSPTLRESTGTSNDSIVQYIRRWKDIGFLDSAAKRDLNRPRRLKRWVV